MKSFKRKDDAQKLMLSSPSTIYFLETWQKHEGYEEMHLYATRGEIKATIAVMYQIFESVCGASKRCPLYWLD
jgi:hypothetical protein